MLPVQEKPFKLTAMSKQKTSPADLVPIPGELIARGIYRVRGQKVMLDSDLARDGPALPALRLHQHGVARVPILQQPEAPHRQARRQRLRKSSCGTTNTIGVYWEPRGAPSTTLARLRHANAGQRNRVADLRSTHFEWHLE